MKRKTKITILVCSIALLLILIFLVCGGVKWIGESIVMYQYQRAHPPIQDVSIIQLIANPEAYDGKLVRVEGVGNVEFEGNGLFLHKEDWKYCVFRNALWLSFGPEGHPQGAEGYNGKYVLVEGIFEKDENGHMGLFSGAITDIRRYELSLVEKETAENEAS